MKHSAIKIAITALLLQGAAASQGFAYENGDVNSKGQLVGKCSLPSGQWIKSTFEQCQDIPDGEFWVRSLWQQKFGKDNW